MSDPKTRDSDFQEAFPEPLLARERFLLRKRRQTANLPPFDQMVGVGLSGGGIRSATFALGLFQGLAKSRGGRRGLLRYIDYLSTVSGGGYFGSFFGQLLTRDYVGSPDDVEDILLQKKEERVLGFLRENGRYLSPNGGGDALLFGSAILRNWVSIHLVLFLFTLSLFLALQLLRTVLGFAEIEPKADASIWWSPFLWLPLLTFALGAVPLGWAYWLVKPERRAIAEGSSGPDEKKEAQGSEEEDEAESSENAGYAALILVFVVSSLLAAFTWGNWKLFPVWATLAVITVLAFGYLRLAATRVPDKHSREEPGQSEDTKVRREIHRNHDLRNRLGLWVTGALVATALLLVVALVDSLGQTVYAVLKGESSLGAWLAGTFGSLGILAGFGRWIAMFFSKGPQGGRPSLPLTLIATIAAVVIVLLLLVTVDTASHAIAFGLKPPAGAPAGLLETKEKGPYSVDVKGGGAAVLDMRLVTSANEEKGSEEGRGERNAMLAFLGFASTLLLSIFFGQTWPFVNRSSHLPLYAARLTRAYLGASNRKRHNGTNITEPVEGDDTDLSRYWPPPEKNGAPIHLINVTINETIDGRSQIQQQDRKGLGMALGPCGLSAGVRHHLVVPLGNKEKMKEPEDAPIYAVFPQGEKAFRVFDYPDETFSGEALPLGTWLSISGAAFSTGTGMRTSLGLSFLAGLANVRLGRWWDSGVVRKPQPPEPGKKPPRRKLSLQIEDVSARLFPVQTYLLDEFLARFPGTSRRHWYLSDGGHFENMGGYELLRRRLRFILIVDGEMDADFTYGGLANLVRKARIDFGAEVRFLTEDQLDKVLVPEVRPYIGTLDQLKRGVWKDVPEDESKPHGHLETPSREGFSLAHAALARVTYASADGDPEAFSWLLYVKPTLTGREPVDVREYHAAHPIFPHEPTIDQFFDEAQWESYRRLGEYIADVLFCKVGNLLPEGDDKTLLRDWKWTPDWKEPEDMAEPPAVRSLDAGPAPQTAKPYKAPSYS